MKRRSKPQPGQVVANELHADKRRIDLGAVASHYVDETQKQLERLIDEAENAGGLVFFDEADALFGKRSLVRRKDPLRCIGAVSAVIATAALAFLVIRRGRNQLDNKDGAVPVARRCSPKRKALDWRSSRES